MQFKTYFGILAVVTASASLVACGSDTSTTSTTGAGGSSSTTGDTTSSGGGSASTSSAGGASSTSTSGSSTSSSTGASTGSSTSTGGSMLVNGCDPMALVDHTKDATVEITFGGAVGLKYAPPCIKIKSGTKVTFTGNLGAHPLAAGEVVMNKATNDPTSPIKTTSMGTTVSFTIAAAGSYPYYCDEHYTSGMVGLIVAE